MDLVLVMICILIVFLFLPVLFLFFPLLFGGAPYNPMPRDTARKMLAFADVKPGEKVYDLGSGDGRVVIIAAEEFRVHATGIELEPLRAAYARFQIRKRGLQDRAHIQRGNFFKTNLSDADVVTMFQLQPTNDMLREKLERELRPGTRVVSYVWIMKGWKPMKEDKENQLYLYVIGKNYLMKRSE